MNIIEVEEVEFSWPKAAEPAVSLDKFYVKKGEKVFIRGPSGSGKSTLLSLLTGINTVDSKVKKGRINILGKNLKCLSNRQRDQFRADHIGYIFQQFNLIPYLNVIENVLLPCHFSNVRSMKVTNSLVSTATNLLVKLQLPAECHKQDVTKLSIGQQQRVAVARALIGDPEIIIADEPSSALDKKNSLLLIKLLVAECEQRGATLLFVSHDESLEPYFDRTYSLCELNQAERMG
jgi:putative ABC transport system ATP-binding protein